MTAESFVAELAVCRPSIEDYRAIGASESGAAQMHRRYQATRKDVPAFSQDPMEEILRLLQGWDVSTVEVGLVGFAADVSFTPDLGWIVGAVEIDPLVLREDNGEIDLRDFYQPSHVMSDVARNGSSFLDALIHAAQYFSDCVKRRVDSRDVEVARRVAEECAVQAGGPQYLRFYRSLCGGD